MDDLLLLPALIALSIKLIPADVLEQCRAQAENQWTDGKPKKWYYTVPIISVWALLTWFFAHLIWFRK